MENNEIMKRLMEDDSHIKSQQTTPVKENRRDSETSLSRIRVVTAKYKVLSVLFLIFICILGIYIIPDKQNEYNNTVKNYDAEVTKFDAINNKIIEAQKDMKLLTGIIYNEQNLAECLNNEDTQVCLSLPNEWKIWTWEDSEYDFTIPLSYLQLHSLYNKKLSVDEKKVLKNLNEYLIKEDIEWNSKDKVWNILKISIGDPEPVTPWDEHFYAVPVDVEIEFTEIDDLVWFLYNVEKKLIDKNKWDDRILYKIQTVSYDIIANDEPQITDISMLAYYYYDENFWEKDEESGNLLNEIDEYKYYFEKSDDIDSDASSKSSKKNNSFLDKIFK